MAASPLVTETRQSLCRPAVGLRDWLLSSGIQAPAGHFYAWYDLDRSRFVRPYPEITGYGISTMCWLSDLNGDPGLLERARSAFDFLTEDAIHPVWHLVGTRPLSSLATLAGPTYLYGFDSGMVAAGLQRLASRVSDRRFGRAVDRIAGTFVNHLLGADGIVQPLIDLQAGRPTSGPRGWSQRFSGYQLKSLVFLMLRQAGERRRDEELALRTTVERVLAGQQSCGAFPAGPDGETHLHPHLYTLEALCTGAAVYDEARWLERAAAGYRYLGELLAERSSLPTRARGRMRTVDFERADIVAQFLRVGSYLCSVGCMDRRHLDSDLRWASRRLRRYVIDHGPHRGGVVFGQDWDGTVKRHANCAVTLISAQAFHWYHLAQNRSAIDPLELV